jgi:hypothetical protein
MYFQGLTIPKAGLQREEARAGTAGFNEISNVSPFMIGILKK